MKLPSLLHSVLPSKAQKKRYAFIFWAKEATSGDKLHHGGWSNESQSQCSIAKTEQGEMQLPEYVKAVTQKQTNNLCVGMKEDLSNLCRRRASLLAACLVFVNYLDLPQSNLHCSYICDPCVTLFYGVVYTWAVLHTKQTNAIECTEPCMSYTHITLQ